MEYLNRIELRGCVGSVKVFPVGDTKVARFSLATSVAYRDANGTAVIETTWHNVTAWEGPQSQDVDRLKKGDRVHVRGRMRTYGYTAFDGSKRTVYEVLASQLTVLDPEASLTDEHITGSLHSSTP